MAPSQRRVLVVGGSFSGLAAGRDLHRHFLVTIIDAKEFFEYTPGVLRAFVKPKHLDALSFTLQPVIETRMRCKFVWGEVKRINDENKTATYQPIFAKNQETWSDDRAFGFSLGFLESSSSWPHIDERFLEGRRRHIIEEQPGRDRVMSWQETE
eukprot:Skav217796  [mRNA]  locus=scaffold1782:385299:388559:- [translate_table: standard]